MEFSGASSPNRWTYDVFLSFRGEDTRNKFTAHLHRALCEKGINTYIDNNLERGEKISPALVKAIADSKIAIIVFSKDYASSCWCLDELVKILECKKTKQQTVLPVFYDVDPSDVRKQTKIVGQAFAKAEAKSTDNLKVQKWREALREVADLAGFPVKNRDESTVVQEIIQYLNSTIVSQVTLDVAKHAIGVQPRLQKVNSLLSVETNDVRMLGIYGPGGIGKTTIAKTIYNSIAFGFDGHCFLSNVRETFQRKGLIHLQNELLSQVLRGSSPVVDIVDRGVNVIKQRLGLKRICLVLDDVDHSDQLEKLAGKCDWFGLGSRIIITTRDKNLLTTHEVVFTYPVNGLDDNEALELFSWNAFKKRKPNDDFKELTQQVLVYARGLPLALRVLGSNLFGKELHEWESALEKYKRFPNKEIGNILRTSYDGLEENERKIFLDITCFFKGEDKDYVIEILKNCSCYPISGIKVLVDKSLISIDKYNKLEMHDLIQDMGRDIVQQESQEFGNRSRLCFPDEVLHVLEESTGTNKVRGILVDLCEECGVNLAPKAFKKMKMLKLFINRNASILRVPNYLSNELRLFDWPNYPGESMPSDFHGKNLVVLKMRGSKLKYLKNFESCRNLTVMDFAGCKFLRTTPDLSTALNLRKLEFCGCENLVEVHHSVGSLCKLAVLDLSGCSNLMNFPRSLKMPSLEYLNLYKCWRLNFFPEIECPMSLLEYLQLGFTGIEQFPSSFRNLSGIKKLFLPCCQNLKFPVKVEDDRQPSPSIKSTNESETLSGAEALLSAREGLHTCSDGPEYCFLSKLFSSKTSGYAFTLVELDLTGIAMVCLPVCIQNFHHLCRLTLNDCWKLQQIPTLPSSMEKLYARGCDSLERFRFEPDDSPMFQLIDLYDCRNLRQDIGHDIRRLLSSEVRKQRNFDSDRFTVIFPGEKIPDWFSYHKKASNAKSCELVINTPAVWEGMIKGIAFCAVFGTELGKEESRLDCYIDLFIGGSHIDSFDYFVGNLYSNHILLHYYISEYGLGVGDIRVHFRCESDLAFFESCGIYLVRREKEKVKDLMSNMPWLPHFLQLLLSWYEESIVKGPVSKIFPQFRNLTTMKFPWCKLLRKIPDISGAPNLKILLLLSCKNLVEVDCSVGSLSALVDLNLDGCPNLRIFPRSLKLRSLVSLNLNRCRMLSNFPEFECPMEHLANVQLGWSGIEELPSSFGSVNGLQRLGLCNVGGKGQARPSVGSSKVSETSMAVELLLSSMFCGMTSGPAFTLLHLDIRRTDVISLPTCIQNFRFLRLLSVDGCKKLQEILALPSSLKKLYARGCKSLERFRFNADDSPVFRRIDLNDCHSLRGDIGMDVWDLLSRKGHRKSDEFNISFPGQEIPDWFNHHKEALNNTSCEIVINELERLDGQDGEIRGIAFCAVFGIANEKKHTATSCFVALLSDGSNIYSFDNLFLNLRPNHMVLHYYVAESFELRGDDIRIHFRCESDVAFFVRCGVHLVRRREKRATNPAHIHRHQHVISHMDLSDEDTECSTDSRHVLKDDVLSIHIIAHKVRGLLRPM